MHILSRSRDMFEKLERLGLKLLLPWQVGMQDDVLLEALDEWSESVDTDDRTLTDCDSGWSSCRRLGL